MKTLAELMSVYHHHHTKKITKFTHFIRVPMIIFAIEILLSWPQIANIPLSWIAVIILGTYYLYLDAGWHCDGLIPGYLKLFRHTHC